MITYDIQYYNGNFCQSRLPGYQWTAANVGWLIRMQHLDSQPLEDVIEESIQQTLPVEDEPWNQ